MQSTKSNTDIYVKICILYLYIMKFAQLLSSGKVPCYKILYLK